MVQYERFQHQQEVKQEPKHEVHVAISHVTLLGKLHQVYVRNQIALTVGEYNEKFSHLVFNNTFEGCHNQNRDKDRLNSIDKGHRIGMINGFTSKKKGLEFWISP